MCMGPSLAQDAQRTRFHRGIRLEECAYERSCRCRIRSFKRYLPKRSCAATECVCFYYKYAACLCDCVICAYVLWTRHMCERERVHARIHNTIKSTLCKRLLGSLSVCEWFWFFEWSCTTRCSLSNVDILSGGFRAHTHQVYNHKTGAQRAYARTHVRTIIVRLPRARARIRSTKRRHAIPILHFGPQVYKYCMFVNGSDASSRQRWRWPRRWLQGHENLAIWTKHQISVRICGNRIKRLRVLRR